MLQGVVLGGGILLIVAAATIPFLFESSSLYYKLGVDGIMLRSGKMLGLLAAMLILFQVIPVSRFVVLERIFSLKHLYSFHKTSGKIILGLGLLHLFFIVAAENFTFFPLEKRYWPELVGVVVLLLVVGVGGMSVWQSRLGLSWNSWQRLHRWMTPLIETLLLVHILFVSESFDSGIPRVALFSASGGAMLLFLRIYYRRIFNK